MSTETEFTAPETTTTESTQTTEPIATDTEVSAEGQPPKPEYVPNYKYKVHGQEKEFDKWLQASIKDQESEKRARDLYTRAEGMDYIKQDREQLSGELQRVKTEQQNFNASLSELSHYVKTDDMQTFFEKLGIPKEQVLRYALREVQFADNPQLRQQYDAQRMANAQMYNQQLAGANFMSQYEQASVGLRERELAMTTSSPEIANVAQAFDSRVGRPGAFRDEVINRGQLHWHTRGVDMPVDAVVREVIQLYGLGQAQGNGVVGNQTGGVVAGSGNKPVIPTIPGSGHSAVKKQIKGIAGLKARLNELQAG